VKQGCPLAPYLFLLVNEVLNTMVKEAVKTSEVVGIKLPAKGRQ